MAYTKLDQKIKCSVVERPRQRTVTSGSQQEEASVASARPHDLPMLAGHGMLERECLLIATWLTPRLIVRSEREGRKQSGVGRMGAQ